MPIKINGATSGSTTISAPATGSDETIELSTALASKLPYSYGTATPSTTTSGFLWYDSNATPPTPKYWNGSSFANLAPAPGLELVTTQSFSAVSSISVNSCFSSTYDNYLLQVHITSVATDGYIFLRLRASGTDSTASYSFAAANARTTSNSVFFFGGTGLAELGLLNKLNAVNSAIYSTTVNILGPNKAAHTAGTWQSSGVEAASNQYAGISGGWNHAVATAYDGFTLHNNAGTITGTLRVYGYKN